ncbi:hypothetical protein [Myxococcus landrumensis]|uniref:Tetratricopeptide repeat protein n=1 Tax=Myxococcus landrumensis TaxID=2813577 RepID=A0ABX7NFP7_9BACT|nr:hypothetical protein [Myxococcus landrumus]QSQ17637.1 hypothetical protein JY572_17020 [Myxococcus landrumus]
MWLAVVMTVFLGQTSPSNPYLEQAWGKYESLHFAEAVELLRLAEQVPTSTRAQRLEILELRARCELAEGRRADAEESYTRMLTLEPRAEPPVDLSPKILEAFQAVKRGLFPAGYLALKQLPSTEGLVRVEVVDPWRQVSAVVLRWRGGPDEDWSEAQATTDEGRWLFELPMDRSAPVRWYVEARDAEGKEVARLGEPASEAEVSRAVVEPLLAPAPRPGVTPEAPVDVAASSRLRTTLGWVAVGAAVAAGVGGAVLQVRSHQSREAAERAEWARDSRRYSDRARSQAGWATGLFAVGGAAALGGGYLFAW